MQQNGICFSDLSHLVYNVSTISDRVHLDIIALVSRELTSGYHCLFKTPCNTYIKDQVELQGSRKRPTQCSKTTITVDYDYAEKCELIFVP